MKLNRMFPKDLTMFQLEMETLAQWVRDNDHVIREGNHTFPVVILSSGNYGTCLKLLNYPGLVIKTCRHSHDGYPEYIRAITRLKNPRKWMPKILAHGGNEATGMFWCVMPEYDNPTGHQTWGNDAGWFAAGGARISDACSVSNLRVKAIVQSDFWSGGTRTVRRKEPRDRKERRFFRQVREFLHPMAKAGAGVYMHPNNALLDGDQWIITDPIAGWDLQEKEKFRHANS